MCRAGLHLQAGGGRRLPTPRTGGTWQDPTANHISPCIASTNSYGCVNPNRTASVKGVCDTFSRWRGLPYPLLGKLPPLDAGAFGVGGGAAGIAKAPPSTAAGDCGEPYCGEGCSLPTLAF